MMISIQSTVDTLMNENPALSQIKIRVDKESQKASVVDVVRMVTGQNAQNANQTLRRIDSEKFAKCELLKINKKGRATYCADAPTCIEIIWELPGKAARAFRRQSAHYICRILGGDLTLATEIERRYQTVSPEAKQFLLQNVASAINDDKHKVWMAEQELRLSAMRAELREKEMKLQNTFITSTMEV